MGLDLYYVPGSAPCRSVLLTAKALNLDLNLKLVDLHGGEHLKPEFLIINPQHCVPTLVDNGFSVWESRAIIVYLVEKYGKGSSLYPANDPAERANILRSLFFDAGTLYQRFGDAYYPHMFGGAPLSDENLKKIDQALEILDNILAKSEFVASKTLTLADISIVASITTIEAVGFNVGKYSNISRWLTKAKTLLPGYEEANGKGVQAFRELFLNCTKK